MNKVKIILLILAMVWIIYKLETISNLLEDRTSCWEEVNGVYQLIDCK